MEWARKSCAIGTDEHGLWKQLVKQTIEGQFKGNIDYRWDSQGLNIAIRLPLHLL
jgi:hypothetical protein